jgi:hypothetical protein
MATEFALRAGLVDGQSLRHIAAPLRGASLRFARPLRRLLGRLAARLCLARIPGRCHRLGARSGRLRHLAPCTARPIHGH